MPEKVPRKLRSIKKTTTIEFEIELNVWKGLPKREGGRCRSTHIVKVAEPFQIGQLVVVIVVRAMSQHIRFLVGRKLMRCICRLIASRLTIELKEDEEGGGEKSRREEQLARSWKPIRYQLVALICIQSQSKVTTTSVFTRDRLAAAIIIDSLVVVVDTHNNVITHNNNNNN